MRAHPLVHEVFVGLMRPGKAHLDYLGLLLVQAVVLFLWWPKDGVAQVLQNQHAPSTLMALVMALGVTSAYFALRMGTEESALREQQGLRAWIRGPLPPGSVLGGYIIGQLLHSLHLLALSSPLLLMAFTVSGGEWTALGWCIAAVLVQALFYRLCGASIHLSLGQHRHVAIGTARALMVIIYVPLGLLAPVTSHLALAYRTLGGSAAPTAHTGAMPDGLAFLVIYAALSAVAALAAYRLILRERGVANTSGGSGMGKAFTP